MTEQFDFVLGNGRWRWFKRRDGHVVAQAADSFESLGECVSSARDAGFHAAIDLRDRSPSPMI